MSGIGAVDVAQTAASKCHAKPNSFSRKAGRDLCAPCQRCRSRIGQAPGGTLAADFVAKSDPDGDTLLLSSASLSSQVIFHKKLPYDAIRDFAPVSFDRNSADRGGGLTLRRLQDAG